MFKNYLRIGFAVALLTSTQTFATNDPAPTFIDGEDVQVRVSYLRSIAIDSSENTQPRTQQFQGSRLTKGVIRNGMLQNYTRLSRVTLTYTGDFLNTLNPNSVLTFKWQKNGNWVYALPTDSGTDQNNILTIAPVTKIKASSENRIVDPK